jgi:nucleotide-binding universal stress UspA family protein
MLSGSNKYIHAFEGGTMYGKILVPLDGSELAECSLEEVKKIGREGGAAEVILLRVVEPIAPSDAFAWAQAGYTIADMHTRKRGEAQEYLSLAVENLKKAGIPARGEVLDGRAAETIIDYAKGHQIDLIIISSHGRSGITRWAFGSVADRVVRHSTIPTLLVSAPGCRIASQEILAPTPQSGN